MACNKSSDLNEIAEMADRIMEISRPSVAAVSGSTGMEALLDELKKLNSRISKLEGRGRSRSKSQHRGRGRSKSQSGDPSLCWYHNKFKEAASKCKEPCTWKAKGNDST